MQSRLRTIAARFAAILCLPALLSACVDIGATALNLPDYFNSQRKIADISYGTEPWQKLDIYLPENTSSKPYPVIVFFYGGSWNSGSKDLYRFVAASFTNKGYAVVIPDYAQYPDHLYPQFAKDGAAAIAFVTQQGNAYNMDARNILLSGHSAGGHIAALLATNNTFLEQAGVNREVIKAFAGLAAPYDFVPEDADIKAVFAPAGGNASAAMPATFIDGKQPPMLALWGEDDDVVGFQNIESVQRMISEHGGELEVIKYPGVGHIGIIGALSRPLGYKAPAAEDMHRFFQKHISDANP